jgi:hypothetical protein
MADSTAPIEINLQVAIVCSADTRDLDKPENLEKLKRLWTSREKYTKWIETRARGAIETACFGECLALLQRKTHALAQAIALELTEDLHEKGLILNSVDVTEINFAPELFEAVMTRHRLYLESLERVAEMRLELLSAQLETEAQRQYAEQIPALSLPLLFRDDKQGLREYLNNAMMAVNGLVERSGSGAEGKQLIQAIFSALNQLPGATPPPLVQSNNVDVVIQSNEKIADEMIRTALGNNIQVAIPLPGSTAGATSGGALNAEVEQAISDCRAAIPQVRVLAKEKSVELILTLASAARLRLVLRDWDDYPSIEPTLARCVVLSGENPEREIRPTLRALMQWQPGSSLTDIARELIERGDELAQG